MHNDLAVIAFAHSGEVGMKDNVNGFVQLLRAVVYQYYKLLIQNTSGVIYLVHAGFSSSFNVLILLF